MGAIGAHMPMAAFWFFLFEGDATVGLSTGLGRSPRPGSRASAAAATNQYLRCRPHRHGRRRVASPHALSAGCESTAAVAAAASDGS